VRLPPRKRCLVAYATPARQYLWPIELPPEATIAAALAACRAAVGESADGVLIPWDSAPVGVFGEPRARTAPCAHGDRIELYRPLERDPRARRRERVARERRGAR
jgi:putative ubiquitin-RnfH superfamily antitoxin RatB of RatAB toxin-antitoxin module